MNHPEPEPIRVREHTLRPRLKEVFGEEGICDASQSGVPNRGLAGCAKQPQEVRSDLEEGEGQRLVADQEMVVGEGLEPTTPSV